MGRFAKLSAGSSSITMSSVIGTVLYWLRDDHEAATVAMEDEEEEVPLLPRDAARLLWTTRSTASANAAMAKEDWWRGRRHGITSGGKG